MQTIPVNIEARGRAIKFHLELDPARQHDAWLMRQYHTNVCYESEVCWLMLRVLQEGDVVIDAGANLGFFTVLMSMLVGATGDVIACEPDSVNLAKLQGNIIKNGLENVSVMPNPLWKTGGEVNFYVNSDDGSSSALWDVGEWFENVKSKANPKRITKQAITLDQLGTSRPKLIKIDTEGAEQAILEGGDKLLDRHPPYIVAELNPFGLKQLGYSDESFRVFMKQRGYDMFFLHAGDLMPTLVPPQTKIAYVNNVQVKNVLFSTLGDVAKAWPEALE